MHELKKRLAEAERTRGLGVDRARLLPEAVCLPADEPARSRVLASVERKRALGQRVIAVDRLEDAMSLLIDEFAP